MKAHPLLLFVALIAIVAPLQAVDNTVVAGVGSGQSAAEIDDIGEISEPGTPGATASTGHFRLDAGFHTDYTSNAKLTGNHGSGDAIWFPTIEAGYHIAFGRGFAFDALARLESGLYTSNTDRSYYGYSLETTLEWRPKPSLPRLFIGVEPYRYEGADSRNLITEAVGVSAGSDWGYAFNNGRSLFFLGYTLTDYIADPGIDTRYTNAAIIGVTHLIRPKLFAQLFYQYQYVEFETIDRTDHRQVVGLTFIYHLTEHLFSTLGGNFVNSDSTENHASYQSAGASFGLNYHF